MTLGGPLSFMDNKNMLFGRVIVGMRTFRMIEKLECVNEKPGSKIKITSAGMLCDSKKTPVVKEAE